MPLSEYISADELDAKVIELERSGQQVKQVVPMGIGFVVLYGKAPGRPAKETR